MTPLAQEQTQARSVQIPICSALPTPASLGELRDRPLVRQSTDPLFAVNRRDRPCFALGNHGLQPLFGVQIGELHPARCVR